MSASRVSIRVAEDDAGHRLDRFVASRLDGVSRTQVQALNAAGAITVNGEVRADSYSLSEGETIDVFLAMDEFKGQVVAINRLRTWSPCGRTEVDTLSIRFFAG